MALEADAAGNIDVVGAVPRPFALPAAVAGIPKATFGAIRLLALIGAASTIVAVVSLTVLGGAYYLLTTLAH